METVSVLTKILRFGIENEYFKLKLIKDLDKSCCKQNTNEVIDFDKTKEKIEKEFKVNFASCDALLINSKDEKIDFIEMKSFKNLIKYNSNKEKFFFQKKIENFKFTDKIIDSLQILSLIAKNKNLDLERKKIHLYNQVEKNFIVLIDINLKNNPLEVFTIGLNYLANNSNLKENLINCTKQELSEKKYLNQSENLLSPQLMDCETFKEYCQ